VGELKGLRGKENAQRALKEIGITAHESNPSPGSMISMPVFGYELFVAQSNHDTILRGCNRKLFTSIHKFYPPR
jgi:hypothetical protein